MSNPAFIRQGFIANLSHLVEEGSAALLRAIRRSYGQAAKDDGHPPG